MSLATFENNQRRRKPNLSRRQQNILLQEVVNNQDLLFADPHTPQYNDMKLIVWKQITDKINQADPNGEVRSPLTVRRKWINWLSFAKKKAEVYKRKIETGEPCHNTDYLTPIENSILKIARDRNFSTEGQADASNEATREEGCANTFSDASLGSDSIEGSAHAPIEIKQESQDDSLLELCEISSVEQHNTWEQSEGSVIETPQSRTNIREAQRLSKEQVSSITFAPPDTSDFVETEVVINRAPYPTAVYASQSTQSQNTNTVLNNVQSTTTIFDDRQNKQIDDMARKKRKLVHISDDSINEELLSVQNERLEVEKNRLKVEEKRLKVEEKRLKVEEERLRIETERFEMERKKMNYFLAMS